MDEREVLRTVPIFSELSDEDITSLAHLALRKRYPKDTVIFFENEEGDFFFTILEGRVKVTILGDDGREVILSVLGPGDFFGEMALLDNEPRSATAIAVEETELLSLHRNDFLSTASCTAPIFSSAPLPRPLRTAARASSRCTPSVSKTNSFTSSAPSSNTPVPQNAEPMAKPHSAARNSLSSCRTWKMPIAASEPCSVTAKQT